MRILVLGGTSFAGRAIVATRGFSPRQEAAALAAAGYP